MEPLLTVDEAARYLRVNRQTVYRWVSKNILPAVKVGRHWRIQQSSLEEWLQAAVPRMPQQVLVVDDEPVIGHLFQGTLEQGNYRVSLASNGLTALELLSETLFSLIFLDLRMPGIDGAETFKRIRETDAAVPVVIMTGYPESDMMARALEIGPVGVMMKPFGPDEIERATASFAR